MNNKQQEAIQILLTNHPYIFIKLFDGNYLRDDVEILKQETRHYSEGEQLLRDMALDLYNGSGNCNIHYFLSNIDEQNKQLFQMAMTQLIH